MIHIQPKVWRFLGFMSSVVGFICYAFSSSFHNLFGHWTLLKIVLYSLLSIIFSVLTLLVDKFPKFFGGLSLKSQVGFLVLMLTSLYSFYEDGSEQPGEEDEKGRQRNMLSLVSFASFAFMSVSLSKQIQPEFDVGMSNFFLGCFIVAVMKMNIKIAVGVSALFYVLITVRSCWDSSYVGDTERAIIMAHQPNDMQTLADNNGEDEEQGWRIEMRSLVGEGHGELTEEETGTNLEWLKLLKMPSPILIRHISFKTLNCLSLSAAEYSTLQSSDWDFTKALRSVGLFPIGHRSFKTLNYLSLSAAEYSTLQSSDWDFIKALRSVRFLKIQSTESKARLSQGLLEMISILRFQMINILRSTSSERERLAKKKKKN